LNPHNIAVKIMIITKITTSEIIAKFNQMSVSIYINFKYEIWKIKSVQINITMIKNILKIEAVSLSESLVPVDKITVSEPRNSQH